MALSGRILHPSCQSYRCTFQAHSPKERARLTKGFLAKGAFAIARPLMTPRIRNYLCAEGLLSGRCHY